MIGYLAVWGGYGGYRKSTGYNGYGGYGVAPQGRLVAAHGAPESLNIVLLSEVDAFPYYSHIYGQSYRV